MVFSDTDECNSDLNRRVRRDVEYRNILIEDNKIEALKKEMKEAEVKMEEAFISYQSYLTDYMGKRDYLETRIRSQSKNMTRPHPVSQTECRQLLINGPLIEYPRVVTITKVRYDNDDIFRL